LENFEFVTAFAETVLGRIADSRSGKDAFPCIIANRFLASLVNVSPVSHIVKINATLLDIEFVKNTIIADPQFELRAALQFLVLKTGQPPAHVVHLPLDKFTDRRRQLIERFRKWRRPDLQGRRHDYFGCRVV